MKHVDPTHLSDSARLPLRFQDWLLGALGSLTIHATLLSVRVWAKVTGTPYLDD